MNSVQLTPKGMKWWHSRHPWVYRSDCQIKADIPAGVVIVQGTARQDLELAFYSPQSQIALRRLHVAPQELTADFWRQRLQAAHERRQPLQTITNAYRVVFGECDFLPSIVIDRYNDIAVLQTMSAGAETIKELLLELIPQILPVTTVVERNDVPIRELEGLPQIKRIVQGNSATTLIRDGALQFEVDCMAGQKTGAFLDHRASRHRLGQLAHGRVLDCFSYEGWFAAHMAAQAQEVITVDVSTHACERVLLNLTHNQIQNVNVVASNVFDYLKHCDETGEKFDVIHLDPPAFVKNRHHLSTGLKGYKEINLRAMRCLRPGGLLITSSCSQHLTSELMIDMLRSAAADVGRDLVLQETLAQDLDHPILLNFPESHYLKGYVLKVVSA